MEPLRGGRLAKLSDTAAQKLSAIRPDENVPAWAFRFLQSIDGVVVSLSGMWDMEQLRDNIHTFETERKLSGEEMETLLGIADDMVKQNILPCTACRYCTSHCPKGIDEHNFTGGGFIAPMALMAVPEDKQPSACVGCRSCEAVCPQQIKISEAMADFCAKLKG